MGNIVIVNKADKDGMRNMFQEYMEELSQYDDTVTFDENGKVEYKWFEDYWVDKDRYPIYYKVDGAIVGMAMVRQMSDREYQIAEFYMIPRFRGVGYSKEFALSIINMFLGDFQFATKTKNMRAVRFWDKVVSHYKETKRNVENDSTCWNIKYL